MSQVAEILILSIGQEFTNKPGARNDDEGKHSGEKFLSELLLPRFAEALENDQILHIDLDGTEGYATSFLEEAFGGLARKYEPPLVIEHLEFKSEDEPLLIEEIRTYILQARG